MVPTSTAALSRRAALLLAVAVAALLLAPLATGAKAAGAPIHPGIETYTDGAQCTANFVFTDDAGDLYIGQAAHCAGTGAATETNGCRAKTLPEGTAVTYAASPFAQDVALGTIAYSSWVRMQALGERDANTCAYNDLALVRLAPGHAGVDPTIPFWGGPAALGGPTGFGDDVYSYGNSELRLGVSALGPKYGTSLGDGGGGWYHLVYTATPGIPGDSGSAFLDADGNAIGVLSTVALAPYAASNNVTDLAHELAYAQAHSGIPGLRLVPGTEPFEPLL